MSAQPITRIRPGRGWFDIPWRDFFAHGELLLLLARRDVSIVYKQTILGPAWFLIQPVLTALVFSVIFGRVAGIQTNGMPRFLFYIGGLLVWNYFRGVMEGASQSFESAKALFSKVYFPRMVVPVSYAVSHLVYLGLNTLVFFLFFAWQALFCGVRLHPTWWLLAAPLLVAWIAATALGFGMLVAALTTKYRDLRFSLPFIMQAWMYSSAIIYPLDGVKDPFFRKVLECNPVGVAAEAVRYMLMGRGTVTWRALACSGAVAAVALVLGLGAFNRAQRDFVDTI